MRQSLLARPQQQKASNPFGSTAYSYSGGRLIAYNDKQETYISKGYQFNDIVYSIVKLITEKSSVAPWGIYTIEDESAYKQLVSLTRKSNWHITDYPRAVKLHAKALKPVVNTGKWGELIKYPNESQCFTDFVADGIGYKLITGNKYVWANVLTAGANAGTPQSLWLLPSQFVSIDALDTFPAKINGYSIAQWPNAKFEPSVIMHEKFWNPEWGTSGSHLYGQAPLKAALRRLQKNNSLVSAEAATFQNEGIKGILHMKAQPGQADSEDLLKEVGRLKSIMKTEWTGEENRGRMGLGAYDMGWLPIGFTSEEMQMIESGMADLRFMCNVFGGVPSQLLNDPQNKVYANVKEGEKALTSRCVLPHLCSFKDNFNKKAVADWGLKSNWVIDFDLSAYSELQADVKEVSDWYSKLIAAIPDEQRELCSLAATNDPAMQEIWVMTGGRVPLTDFQQSQTDDALNNETDI